MQDLPETKIPCILPLAAKDVKDLRQNPGYSNVDIFTYEEMRLTTNQFRPDYILGEGGFGAVYKGVIDETVRPGYKYTAVAIKELNPDGFQGDREWLCQNGHTLCSTYKARVHNQCPTCRSELGDIRCLALEKVAESLELPCKYCNLGCPEIFPYYSKLKHEAACNFRPYNCPCAGSECSVVGDIPFLVAYLRDDHKMDMHTGCTFR